MFFRHMNGFVQGLVSGSQKSGQKLCANRGRSTRQDGYDDWLAFDQSGSARSVVMQEGAFTTGAGKGDTRFYPEASWKRQVDLLGIIQNSRITYHRHTDLAKYKQDVNNRFVCIYVNPSKKDTDSFALLEASKLLTYENLLVLLRDDSNVASVSRPTHRDTFVR